MFILKNGAPAGTAGLIPIIIISTIFIFSSLDPFLRKTMRPCMVQIHQLLALYTTRPMPAIIVRLPGMTQIERCPSRRQSS